MKTCNYSYLYNEKQIAYIWKYYCENKCFNTDDSSIKIIYSGRKSGEKGCDFQDAIFNINGKHIVGDVEIHIRTKQWYQHKHHLDTAYIRVALHVVMWKDSGIETVNLYGRGIPTISLSQFFTNLSSSQFNAITTLKGIAERCHRLNQKYSISKLSSLLIQNGKLRFLNKARAIGSALSFNCPEQVIYQYLARAMGYLRNSSAFEELTQKLPVTVLRNKSVIKDISAIKALLIGTAGLLPSQRLDFKPERHIEDEEIMLENIWATKFHRSSILKNPWISYLARPENVPLRRLVALGILIYRMGDKGLYINLLDLVRLAYKVNRLAIMTDGIIVTDEIYWDWHLDFGLKLNKRSAVIGSDRASEIIINTILPFAYIYGMSTADNHLKDMSLNLFLEYPALEQNYITRYMQALLLNGRDIHLNAVMQQGLINIFQHSCRLKLCLSCPISNLQKKVLVSHPN